MELTAKQVLEQNGIDKISFLYYKSEIVNNVFTSCTFFNTKKESIEARGIAICSLLDAFSKMKGKNKAYGRAVKALVRKQNFDKINGEGRISEYVSRSFKVKNEIERERFIDTILPELLNIDPCIKIAQESQNGHGRVKFTFALPLHYPVMLTNKYFRYKSAFRPTPVLKEERDFLGKIDGLKDGLFVQISQ